MRNDTHIPRRLDDAWKIAFWDVDVALPVFAGFFLGYMSGSKFAFALCTAIGIFVSRWFIRIKADRHPAFALHWAYWHLPRTPLTAMKATPPSHVHRMVG